MKVLYVQKWLMVHNHESTLHVGPREAGRKRTAPNCSSYERTGLWKFGLKDSEGCHAHKSGYL